MTGLCGDCNGQTEDELNTKDGQVTTGTLYDRHFQVGNSYQVVDPENTDLV